MVKKVLIINGPNLNLLGTREPDVYGNETLEDIEAKCIANSNGLDLEFKQSNHEGEIIDWIQEAPSKYKGVIINAGGYTHTSVAIMDALKAIDLPIIEVHMTNIYKREEFRHKSLISHAATGIVSGFGSESYILALKALSEIS